MKGPSLGQGTLTEGGPPGLEAAWRGGRPGIHGETGGRAGEIKSAAIGFVVWLAVSLAAGWFGSRYAPGEWYASLVKPAWTPPSAVFAPVWTTLYVMMGVAAWLVWRQAGFSGAALPLGLFAVQLVLNGLWSYIFFGRHLPGPAFVEIVALWLVILGTLVGFWRVRPLAGALLLPYLCWVGFASGLNLELWRLNG